MALGSLLRQAQGRLSEDDGMMGADGEVRVAPGWVDADWDVRW